MTHAKHIFLLIPMLMIVFHPVFAQAETEAAEALSGTAQRVTVTQRSSINNNINIRNPQTTTQTQKKTCNILHAEDQYYDEEQKKCLVEPGGCELGYKANEKFTMCVVNEGGICYPQDPDKPDPNAPQIGGYEFNAQAKCVLVKCNDGYKPESNKCIVDAKTEPQAKQNTKDGKECSKSDLKKLSHATAGTYKCTGNSCTCSATKCEDDYIAKDDVCKVNRLAECSVKPDFATEYYIEERNGNAVCIIKDCDDTHTVDATYNECVTFDPLTKELRSKISPFIGEFRAKVSSLQQNNGEG